tara:strand:+ start:1703 stop:2269 length:567 start_codon:yes stop_codon:yes gene_type:complete
MISKYIQKLKISVDKACTVTILILILFVGSACSVPKALKPSKVDKDRPINAYERAKQNIEKGKGVSLKGLGGGKTTYEFSTSNPLWRASLELIDFMPLTTVDYSGGIIITDWYSDNANTKESIKITVRFLSNEVRSDSVKIIVHNKKCKTSENCAINEIDSKIKFELRKSILAKAAQFEKAGKSPKKK